MSGGANLGGFIDEGSLSEELVSTNPNYGPHRPHPFAAYVKRVIAESGVKDSKETREMASQIAGVVARLPFLPDPTTKIEDDQGRETTEFEQQIVKTARRAEAAVESEMVWTASALKLSRTALEMRKRDPDGSKGVAWVNPPLPGEMAA
jgi:hypothetical protein